MAKMVSEGKSTGAIAFALRIEANIVAYQLTTIYRKLGLKALSPAERQAELARIVAASE